MQARGGLSEADERYAIKPPLACVKTGLSSSLLPTYIYLSVCGGEKIKNIMTKEHESMNRVTHLKKVRQAACDLGDIYTQQVINYEILAISKKLKVDYYSIA